MFRFEKRDKGPLLKLRRDSEIVECTSLSFIGPVQGKESSGFDRKFASRLVVYGRKELNDMKGDVSYWLGSDLRRVGSEDLEDLAGRIKARFDELLGGSESVGLTNVQKALSQAEEYVSIVGALRDLPRLVTNHYTERLQRLEKA